MIKSCCMNLQKLISWRYWSYIERHAKLLKNFSEETFSLNDCVNTWKKSERKSHEKILSMIPLCTFSYFNCCTKLNEIDNHRLLYLIVLGGNVFPIEHEKITFELPARIYIGDEADLPAFSLDHCRLNSTESCSEYWKASANVIACLHDIRVRINNAFGLVRVPSGHQLQARSGNLLEKHTTKTEKFRICCRAGS